MSMRMKVQVGTNQRLDQDGGSRLVFFPVYTGSPENEKFFKLTPCGLIDINTVNPAAAAQFKAGDEFFVDFTPATKAAAAQVPAAALAPNPVAAPVQATPANTDEPTFGTIQLAPIASAASQIHDDPSIPKV